MPNLIPGEIINFPKASADKVAAFVTEQIEDLESTYSTYLTQDIPVWWKWLNATPRVREKNFPFRGASNVVIPYIRTISDALIATSFGAVFSAAPRVWTVKSEDEDPARQTLARNVDRHINWAANGNDFNLRLAVYDWLSELYPIGSSILALNWRTDIRDVYFGPSTNDRRKINSQRIEWTRGPVFESAPRENYLWDTRHRIGDAPIVVREHAYTQSDLLRLAQVDPAWDLEAIESIQGSQGDELSPARSARETKDTVESRTSHPGLQPIHLEPHDIREVHLDVPILRSLGVEIPGEESANTTHLPVVLHIHRRDRKLLRATATPYHLPFKPFFDGHYRKSPHRGFSVGLAKILEPIQELMSTLINQAVDSATRANALWGKTTSRRLLQQPIDPAHPMLVGSMDEFEPFTLSTQFLNNLPLINAANVFGERVSGVADPLLGRETRHGGHPAPATSTLALLEQQQRMSIATQELVRDQVSRMGLAVAILYQQFETNDDGKLTRVHGRRDAESLDEFLFPTDPIPTNYLFDVTAMSPNQNPDAEMQRAVLINQMSNDYWGFVLRILQGVESNPNIAPMAKAVALQSIESKTQVYSRFLEASNVDDIEAFIAHLRAPGGPNDPQQFAQFAGAAREIAGGAGAVQQPGLAGAPGGAESGAIVTPAGGGVLLQ